MTNIYELEKQATPGPWVARIDSRMNTTKLRALIEALKEAGRIKVPTYADLGAWHRENNHNAAVNHAAQAALAELDAQAANFDLLLGAAKNMHEECVELSTNAGRLAEYGPWLDRMEQYITEAEKGT